VCMVTDDIEAPGLVWVKDPINPDTGVPTGAPPNRRHHDDCTHWHRTSDGTALLGPPPYLATEEQMRSLSPCQTCLGAVGGRNTSKAGERRHGDPCPTCGMALPLTGVCDGCA
jgi:hypothetical protein